MVLNNKINLNKSYEEKIFDAYSQSENAKIIACTLWTCTSINQSFWSYFVFLFFVISTFFWFGLLALTEWFYRVMAGIGWNKSHWGPSILILIKKLIIFWNREALESVLLVFTNENNLSSLALETGTVNKSSTKSSTQLHKFFLLELNILY